MKLIEQIERKRRELRAAKPRSELASKLYFQLRALMLKELRAENRLDRKRAA